MIADTVHFIPSSPSGVSDNKDALEKSNEPLVSSKSKNKVSRRPCNLPLETVEYLKAWMMSPEHIAHPYPTEKEKQEIMADTGIELKQLTNWFVNNRKRYWKPLVEAKLQKQQSNESCAQIPLNSNSELFHPSLISYPTSAKAMISIVPKIPVTNNFTVPFTQSTHFNRTVSTENLPPLGNPLIDDVSLSPTEVTSTSQLVVNYVPNPFTSPVSENNSVNEDDCNSAASGSSTTSTVYSPAQSCLVEKVCPNDQVAISTIVHEPSKKNRPLKKRSSESFDINSRKQPKVQMTYKWREVCANASSANDVSLPSLDEASKLFGFTK